MIDFATEYKRIRGARRNTEHKLRKYLTRNDPRFLAISVGISAFRESFRPEAEKLVLSCEDEDRCRRALEKLAISIKLFPEPKADPLAADEIDMDTLRSCLEKRDIQATVEQHLEAVREEEVLNALLRFSLRTPVVATNGMRKEEGMVARKEPTAAVKGETKTVAKEYSNVAAANKEVEVTFPGEVASIKSDSISLSDGSTQHVAHVIESESTQDAITTVDQAGFTTQRPRRHGFKANMDRHKAIAEIVSRHAPTWCQDSTAWKERDVLQLICTDLDEAASLDEFGRYEIPERWKKGETTALEGAKTKGWNDALELAPKKLVIDQINASLKMVLKHSSSS